MVSTTWYMLSDVSSYCCGGCYWILIRAQKTETIKKVPSSLSLASPFTIRPEKYDLYSGSWWPMAELGGFQLGVAGEVIACYTTTALPCLDFRLLP